MNNEECKTRPQIVNMNIGNPFFFSYSFKLNSAVVVVIISMTHIQNCVLLMLLKT